MTSSTISFSGTLRQDSLANSGYNNPVDVITSILRHLKKPASVNEICQTLSNKLEFSWKKRFKSKFGTFINFIKSHPERFVVTGEFFQKISLLPTSSLQVSIPELVYSTAEIEPEVLELSCTSRDGSYGGWRIELLADGSPCKLEVKFLLCSYCGGVLRDACLIEEGGRQEFRCFVCTPRDVSKQIAQTNRDVVNQKQIYCPLKFKGCGWTNELSELLHHLEVCGLFPVPCPLGCRDERGEVSRVEREEVETHKTSCPMRAVKCDYCNRKVRSCKMNAHTEHCDEFPVQCPNTCGIVDGLKRKELPLHLSQECPLHEIECPYSQCGCEVRVQRRDLDQHEEQDVRKHLKLATSTVMIVQDKVYKLEKENEQLRNKEFGCGSASAMMSYIVPKWDYEWKIPLIKLKIIEKSRSLTDPFHIGLYKLRICIEWGYTEDRIAYFIYILKGGWDDKLEWPLRYKYTAALINQLDTNNNYERASEVTVERAEECPECFAKPASSHNRGFGWKNFISKYEILQEKYIRDGSITLNISVEQILSS